MSALELLRQIDDDLRHAVESGIAPPSYGIFREWCIDESKKVHAALAEMERDQPFIEAAERWCDCIEADYPAPGLNTLTDEQWQAKLLDLKAAWRARREGMKHAD